MEYHFDFVVKRTHLHAIGSGTHCIDNIRRLFLDTNRVRLEHHLDAVLLEVRFVGRSLSVGDIYSVIVENLPDSSLVRRIAYVDVSAEHLNTDFAELAATRLGLHTRAFRTVAQAEKWLSEGAQGADSARP